MNIWCRINGSQEAQRECSSCLVGPSALMLLFYVAAVHVFLSYLVLKHMFYVGKVIPQASRLRKPYRLIWPVFKPGFYSAKQLRVQLY